MAHTKYENAAQQRVLLTFRFLASRSEGALPIEIAQSLGTLASNTTRDLANLQMAGFVVPVDGRWHCSPKFVALLRHTARPEPSGRPLPTLHAASPSAAKSEGDEAS